MNFLKSFKKKDDASTIAKAELIQVGVTQLKSIMQDCAGTRKGELLGRKIICDLKRYDFVEGSLRDCDSGYHVETALSLTFSAAYKSLVKKFIKIALKLELPLVVPAEIDAEKLQQSLPVILKEISFNKERRFQNVMPLDKILDVDQFFKGFNHSFDNEISSKDDAKIKEINQLKINLQNIKWKERRNIPGDGNCQFHAIADQLDHILSYKALRKIAVDYIKQNSSAFQHGDQSFEIYVQKMGTDGIYGDEKTLQSIANVLRLEIFVMTSDPNGYIFRIKPTITTDANEQFRAIHLCLAADHYGSVDVCDLENTNELKNCIPYSFAVSLRDSHLNRNNWKEKLYFDIITGQIVEFGSQPCDFQAELEIAITQSLNSNPFREIKITTIDNSAVPTNSNLDEFIGSSRCIRVLHRMQLPGSNAIELPGTLTRIDFLIDLSYLLSNSTTTLSCSLVLISDGKLYKGPAILVSNEQKWKTYHQYALSETDFTRIYCEDDTFSNSENSYFHAPPGSKTSLGIGLLCSSTTYGERLHKTKVGLGLSNFMLVLYYANN
eukprot:TRINITY_DN1188_c0_g2_i1.p1 TRINITY_DN1188_c0_g2~~TRINITY_DN1188_c0_g2_i1.p1  ORF type:complete len:551 (+),score=196.81 TRINITY_DN1188_c0_g2_i1:139-1791(+)